MARVLHISLERLREILSYNSETGLFTQLSTGRLIGQKPKRGGYPKISVAGRSYSAHKVAWFIYYGRLPIERFDLHHINGVRSDNRISNLREISRRKHRELHAKQPRR